MIPQVYQAVNAVASALAKGGVAKARLNARDNYLYRSIDDVLEQLAPLLAQHALCILPRVVERSHTDRLGDEGELLVSVCLRVAFDLVSAADGSAHTIEAYGEALDRGDKATAKAMQSAYKYAVLQAFCVPAAQGEDADASAYRLKAATLPPAPPGGWQQWCGELEERVGMCADEETLRHVQDEHRLALASLSREMPELYARLGDIVSRRKAFLRGSGNGHVPGVVPDTQQGKPPPARSKRRANGAGGAPHA